MAVRYSMFQRKSRKDLRRRISILEITTTPFEGIEKTSIKKYFEPHAFKITHFIRWNKPSRALTTTSFSFIISVNYSMQSLLPLCTCTLQQFVRAYEIKRRSFPVRLVLNE